MDALKKAVPLLTTVVIIGLAACKDSLFLI